MRIHVTGNAGAGKTTLARHIGQKFNLPVYHLDQIVWSANWTKPALEQQRNAIAGLTAPDNWVIDGVSEQVRHNADVVIVLATPRYKCMFRCIKRCFQYGFNTRPELPENCPEMKILFRAIRIVWRFPGRAGRQLKMESAVSSNYLYCKDPSRAEVQLEMLLPHLTQSRETRVF